MRKSIRILMVEDSAFDAELIQRELTKSRLDFVARVVDNRSAFEEALTEFMPEVVLSDHSLPGFDSMEALAIFKRYKLHIPFILVTGTVSEEFAVESLKSGADDYILKSALKRLPSAIASALYKKRMENESMEMFGRYKMILEMMPAGCMINDRDFNFIYWNAEAEKIFGYQQHEIAGKSPVSTIVAPEREKELMDKYREIREGKVFESEVTENITSKGSLILCEWRHSRLTDSQGRFMGILSICMNVTEKAAAEREILKFASLVESSTEFIGMTDMKGNLNYLNRAGCELIGLDKEMVKQSRLQQFFPEEDYEKVYKEILPEVLLDGKWEGEFRFRHVTSGTIIQIYFYSYLINDPRSSSPIAVACIAHDITRQKEAEKKLRKSEEKLQAALEELNTFIYKASHDLKGPLSSIIGLLTLVKDMEVQEELPRYLDLMESSTRKLDSVLSGLIETMRVKDIERDSEAIDFNAVIRNVLKSIEYSANFNKVQFNIQVDLRNRFFSYDIIIHSILQNLIENAIKYHNFEQAQAFATIGVKDYRQGVLLTITDNGYGMRKEVLEKIFEMYYRGNESSKGSGLGLYIVKTAVKRLEGEIEVSSEVDKGTRFSIYLPSLPEE